MLQTSQSFRGMVCAPHHLASLAGVRVLQEGGNAIEAMIAAASTIAVVYPHMNALGGDNFWLIDIPGREPMAIEACGAAAARADIAFYRSRGKSTIPPRGPLAALTTAGVVSGWEKALQISREVTRSKHPLSRLLEEAIHYARDGFPVTRSQHANTRAKLGELGEISGFAGTFLPSGRPPLPGDRFRQPELAASLEQLSQRGLDDFYRGELGRALGGELERAGSPLTADDLREHEARIVAPLSIRVAGHQVFNLPPPTQGIASLLLIALYVCLGVGRSESFEFVHGIVEATKAAFRIRDAYVTDPDYMRRSAEELLSDSLIEDLVAGIDRTQAAPWGAPPAGGDTVWLGSMDVHGMSVSFIQSIYWEFGSGFVVPGTGITWQNRGASFSLERTHYNCLQPRRRPFHTIQPALARLSDGRVMAYGTMGGDGQPQTQTAIFARHILHGQELQNAVTAPRWLLGRTWGAPTTNLKIEDRFDPRVLEALRAAGHDLEVVGPFDELMGHAGALVRRQDGLISGAADPRSDGAVIGY